MYTYSDLHKQNASEWVNDLLTRRKCLLFAGFPAVLRPSVPNSWILPRAPQGFSSGEKPKALGSYIKPVEGFIVNQSVADGI